MFEEITKAINERNVLSFYHKGLYRVVEPFTLGTNQKNKIVLSAYQIDGDAHGRDVPSWGLFGMDEISGLQILDKKFLGNREGYKRNDSRMLQIYCEL